MPGEYTHHAVLLINSGDRVAANAAIATIIEDAGETFEAGRGASASGDAPATALYAALQETDEQFVATQAALAELTGAAVLDATSETALAVLETALDEQGLVIVEELL